MPLLPWCRHLGLSSFILRLGDCVSLSCAVCARCRRSRVPRLSSMLPFRCGGRCLRAASGSASACLCRSRGRVVSCAVSESVHGVLLSVLRLRVRRVVARSWCAMCVVMSLPSVRVCAAVAPCVHRALCASRGVPGRSLSSTSAGDWVCRFRGQSRSSGGFPVFAFFGAVFTLLGRRFSGSDRRIDRAQKSRKGERNDRAGWNISQAAACS